MYSIVACDIDLLPPKSIKSDLEFHMHKCLWCKLGRYQSERTREITSTKLNTYKQIYGHSRGGFTVIA